MPVKNCSFGKKYGGTVIGVVMAATVSNYHGHDAVELLCEQAPDIEVPPTVVVPQFSYA